MLKSMTAYVHCQCGAKANFTRATWAEVINDLVDAGWRYSQYGETCPDCLAKRQVQGNHQESYGVAGPLDLSVDRGH